MGMLILWRPCQSVAPAPQHKVQSSLFFLENHESVQRGCLISFQVEAVCPVTSNRGTGRGRDWPGEEPRMRPLGESLLRYNAPLFPHLGFPPLPLSFCFKTLRGTLTGGFCLLLRRKQPNTSHSIKPALTLCDHI